MRYFIAYRLKPKSKIIIRTFVTRIYFLKTVEELKADGVEILCTWAEPK